MKGWGSLSINVIAFVNIVFHKHNESYDASPLLYKYACKYWYPYQIYTRTQTLHIYVILLDLLHVICLDWIDLSKSLVNNMLRFLI